MADREENAWLVVGLGNPGPEYEFTPHNLGFLAVETLAQAHGLRITRREARSLVGSGLVGGRRVIIAKPQTFMNLSGQAVDALVARTGIGPDRLILVYDELALPWNSLRIRPRGSSAGHKGVESVILHLGTNEFARVRLGIHPDHPVPDGAKYVLSPFSRQHRKELDEVLSNACGALESILAGGVEMAMASFNRRASGPRTGEE